MRQVGEQNERERREVDARERDDHDSGVGRRVRHLQQHLGEDRVLQPRHYGDRLDLGMKRWLCGALSAFLSDYLSY